MTWFKVDDNFDTHPKAIAAGNAAVGLWTRCGSWSARQLTNGHVLGAIIPTLGGRAADTRKLVEARLWHSKGHDCPDCPQPHGPGDFVFHQWHENGQPTKAAVEERRTQWRESKAKAREGKSSRRGLKVVDGA